MNDERQCQRRTIDDGGCRQVAISHLDDSDDLKMIKVDRQTDDNFRGNRKCSLKSPDLDFPGEKNLNQNKKIYLTFIQIFESFLKIEKTQIFAFLEKTLIHFLTQTKK